MRNPPRLPAIVSPSHQRALAVTSALLKRWRSNSFLPSTIHARTTVATRDTTRSRAGRPVVKVMTPQSHNKLHQAPSKLMKMNTDASYSKNHLQHPMILRLSGFIQFTDLSILVLLYVYIYVWHNHSCLYNAGFLTRGSDSNSVWAGFTCVGSSIFVVLLQTMPLIQVWTAEASASMYYMLN